MKVSVVGAGIMGLCTAWAIARQGHQVSVFEQGEIPNPLASSCDRHRLIRYPYGNMAGYTRMVRDAYAAWDLLWQDIGHTLYIETGTLALAGTDAKWVEDSAAMLPELGIPMQRLTPDEVVKKCPFLKTTSLEWALFTPTGGALLADKILSALADYLPGQGVALHSHTLVTEIDPIDGCLQLQNGDKVSADTIVVAAGPWVSRLVPEMGDRVTPSRQVVLYLEPPSQHRDLWVRSPMLLDIYGQAKDEGFYAVPPVGRIPMKVSDHCFTLEGNPDGDRQVTEAEIMALRNICQKRIEDFEQYQSTVAKSCFYTVEPEEKFILEKIEKAWVLTGFSGHGFKFGALMGKAVAETISGLKEPAELSHWASGLTI